MKKIYYLIIPLLVCSLIFTSSVGFRYGKNSSVNSVADYNYLPVVIIDPGHGGFDGGAVTADGTPEKDINLCISLNLKKMLDLFGFKTVITRESDISLEDEGLDTIRSKKTSDIHNRMAIMESVDNSIFVSIHQNYYSVERYSGTQVFYSRNFAEESIDLAENIQESVISLIQPNNTRLIKECGSSVYLIYNAVKPAVLVECGFLSNNAEAELLKTEQYRNIIAYCIALGILNYSLKE